MFNQTRTTIARVFARRKLEAVSIGVLGSLAAAGLVNKQTPAEQADLMTAAAVEAEVLDSVATAEAKRPGLSLPDIDHPAVDRWVQRFTGAHRESYATYLSRMTRYEPLITRKLDEKGLPRDLIYLAMIESGFNPTAKSRVAATGLWQFMAPTARSYGLRVTQRVDDRKDPARSTEAAAHYLSNLYDRFGSWYLAAAAYNAGQGRVSRVMQAQLGRTRGTDADFYRIAARLPQETRDYVPKLIAAARIGNDLQKYGFASAPAQGD